MINFVVTWCLDPPRSIPVSIWYALENVIFYSWMSYFSKVLKPRTGFQAYNGGMNRSPWCLLMVWCLWPPSVPESILRWFGKCHILVMYVIFFWYFRNLELDFWACNGGLSWSPWIFFDVIWCLEPPKSVPGSIRWNFKNVKFRSYSSYFRQFFWTLS